MGDGDPAVGYETDQPLAAPDVTGDRGQPRSECNLITYLGFRQLEVPEPGQVDPTHPGRVGPVAAVLSEPSAWITPGERMGA